MLIVDGIVTKQYANSDTSKESGLDSSVANEGTKIFLCWQDESHC